jgi:predicted DNA-binding protein (MmcQ/YjbR family)
MDHDKTLKSKEGLELLANVRKICTLLPEVSEQIDSFGHTSFRVNNKPFVIMGEDEKGASLSVKTTPETQEMLLQQAHYYKTPYIGHHGWVSVRAAAPLDWREIESLVREAYLRVAPKRLVKQVMST